MCVFVYLEIQTEMKNTLCICVLGIPATIAKNTLIEAWATPNLLFSGVQKPVCIFHSDTARSVQSGQGQKGIWAKFYWISSLSVQLYGYRWINALIMVIQIAGSNEILEHFQKPCIYKSLGG